MEYIRPIHNLLFPTRDICYICREKSKGMEGSICKNCYGLLEIVNREVELDFPYVKRAYYAIVYNRLGKEIVGDFKFNGKGYLYRPLGELMVNTIYDRDIGPLDMVIYVPSHRRKEALRGYNQSRLLAEYIAQVLEIPISHDNLIKTRHTKEQRTLNRHDRMINLRDAFKVKDSSEIAGKRLLLIDDILTTGSTMLECGKALMDNGVKEVIGLAITSSKRF